MTFSIELLIVFIVNLLTVGGFGSMLLWRIIALENTLKNNGFVRKDTMAALKEAADRENDQIHKRIDGIEEILRGRE